jgi:protease-4
MSRRAVLLPLIITLLFAALSLGLIASCAMPATGRSIFGDRVGLLYIEGIIATGRQGDSFFYMGETTSDHISKVVKQAVDDKGVKALVVRVNSPGGSAAASQEIYNSLKKFRDTGRPVIVSMGDVAASGGYYIAAAASEIYANPATLTGSIGTIMSLVNYEGLYDLIGLQDRTITAGKYKDIGSPTRPMTSEERQILQGILDQVHGQFKTAVASGRAFDDQKIDEVATGMIFTGEQALANGLVDQLGGLEDAVARAGELAGLGRDPVVDELGKTGLLDQLLGDLGTLQSGHGGVAGKLGQALNPLNSTQNPFYRLWSLILLDPRLAGEEAGVRY